MPATGPIFLTGVNGQVGHELQQTLAPLGSVVSLTRSQLDLADSDAIRRVIREIKPAVIVNPAAYTAVDKAESEPELAFAINAAAPAVMAEEAAHLNALFIHYSTDYVFDGSKTMPYGEQDATNPLGVYGQSKLAGEEAIRAVGANHLILRTSWVYGATGRNFLRTIIRLAQERDELEVVADQLGGPTSSRAVANATAVMLENWQQEKSGTYHLTCAGETSWHGFAQAILRFYEAHRAARGWPPLKVQADALHAITTAEYPTPAARPAYSVLNNAKVLMSFGISMPLWSEALSSVIRELKLEP
ncbi:MAG TPA: dTDP-4-dehydrorhamnose reductase [Methylophilaceae bacterium]|nr:dTDP-4-dehydrorhamnose reductase [Methylophilaceae bacterium]